MLKLITNTGLKLEEAKYYLQRMRETQSHANPHYFQFELNSFLTHARSITSLPLPRNKKDGKISIQWFMEKELGQKPGYESWYDQKVQVLQGNPLMTFMREERDKVVHFNYDTVHTKAVNEVVFIEHIPVSESVRVEVINAVDGSRTVSESTSEPPTPKPTETTFKRTWYFDSNQLSGNTEVTSVCEAYIAILENLLEECRQQGWL